MVNLELSFFFLNEVCDNIYKHPLIRIGRTWVCGQRTRSARAKSASGVHRECPSAEYTLQAVARFATDFLKR